MNTLVKLLMWFSLGVAVLATACGGKNGGVPEPPTVIAPDMEPLYDRDTGTGD